MKARGKQNRHKQTGMNLSEVDIASANEGLLIRSMEIQFEFKHPSEKAWYEIPRRLKIPQATYNNAKAGRGHLGIVKLFEMQKLCESDLVSRFIASKQ